MSIREDSNTHDNFKLFCLAIAILFLLGGAAIAHCQTRQTDVPQQRHNNAIPTMKKRVAVRTRKSKARRAHASGGGCITVLTGSRLDSGGCVVETYEIVCGGYSCTVEQWWCD